MTASELLGYIAAALVTQVMVGMAVVMRRRRVDPAPQSQQSLTTISRSGRAWEGWRDFRVIRRVFEDPAQSQCSFFLQPIDGQPLPDFRPGQYLTFSLELPSSSNEGGSGRRHITRCYSLSDLPDPTGYRITIKRIGSPSDHPEVPAGESSNHFHDRVNVGDLLKVRAPSGQFFLDQDSTDPLVLIGGGIGITPMMSMLRWCLANRPQRAIHLYYGVRNSADHAFKAQLEEMAASHASLRLHVVYSQPAPDDTLGRDYHHAGHITLDLLRNPLPHGHHQFYVCGPAAMMQSLVPALAEWGVPASHIHFEAFGPASVKLPDQAATSVLAPADVPVTFKASGRTVIWDGVDSSLLEFAERNGIAVESGCRSGNCGACETRLIDGSVLYDQTPDFEIKDGYCLLCIGKPAGPLVLAA